MKNRSESLNTGDINLAAAVMSMGVPLCEHQKTSLVLRGGDKFGTYARFHLKLTSIKGDHSTQKLMSYWREPNRCQDNDFAQIMNFVKKGIRSGAKLAEEWLQLAVEHVNEVSGGNVNIPATFEALPEFIEAQPDETHSYLLAFVYNRWDLQQIIKKAQRQIMMSNGDNHVIIDGHLERWKQKELLAMIND